jgi:hypothetical protein
VLQRPADHLEAIMVVPASDEPECGFRFTGQLLDFGLAPDEIWCPSSIG